MTIYYADDVHNDGVFVQFGDFGHMLRCALIECVKQRHYPSERTVDLTLRMASGKKYHYTVAAADAREVLRRLR